MMLGCKGLTNMQSVIVRGTNWFHCLWFCRNDCVSSFLKVSYPLLYSEFRNTSNNRFDCKISIKKKEIQSYRKVNYCIIDALPVILLQCVVL